MMIKPLSMVDAFNLQLLLEDMDVPNFRKGDIDWLSRNLGVRNSEHPDFEEAMRLISRLKR